jgi:hypothetical protein
MDHPLTVYKSPFPRKRLGGNGDGGYVIIDLSQNYDVLLGCGIGGIFSFEDDFLDIYKIPCYAFDGTVDTFPKTKHNVHWFFKNIEGHNSDKTNNLQGLLELYNNIFLKMDIEGSELSFFEALEEKHLNSISQMVVEFHWPFSEKHMDMFRKINNTHVMVHLHGNNNCGMRIYQDTIMPDVFECTYIHKKYFKETIQRNTDFLPTIYDTPNLAGLPDLRLNFPPYMHLY